MEPMQSDPDSQVAGPAAPRRYGRTRRILTSVAASAVLLGGGAAIGIALTGGSAAAGTTSGNPAAAALPAAGHHQCARLALALLRSGHPAAARQILALCEIPLLRLAAVGGIYGQVTFQGKSGTRTLAFERGTIESVTASTISVTAPDGTSWTWDLLPNTIIRSAGQQVPQDKLATGELVLVGGTLADGVYDARLIRIRAGS